MNNFDFLKTYVLEEASADEPQQRHYLYRLSVPEIEAVDEILPVPEELKSFYTNIGYGFFHKDRNASINRLMDPESFKMINLKEEYYEFDIDLELYDEIYQGDKLLFFEVNAGTYLAIDKEANEGKNAIYYFSKKIAASLEDFMRDFSGDPDYFSKIR
jgi:antitoxin YxxD